MCGCVLNVNSVQWFSVFAPAAPAVNMHTNLTCYWRERKIAYNQYSIFSALSSISDNWGYRKWMNNIKALLSRWWQYVWKALPFRCTMRRIQKIHAPIFFKKVCRALLKAKSFEKHCLTSLREQQQQVGNNSSKSIEMKKVCIFLIFYSM